MFEDLKPFGIFSPTGGTRKDVPSILLSQAFTPDNDKVVFIDKEIHRRKMRDYYFKNNDVPVKTPDGYPALLITCYIKESTNTQYFLVFTKSHIYCWNPDTETFDTKYTLSEDTIDWHITFFNDKIVATSGNDYVLIWDGTGNFTSLSYKYGIVVGYTGEKTTVDADSAAEQKVLNVASTTNFVVGDVVIINKGGEREEKGKIDTIQAGESITLYDNLVYAHTQSDADEVEVCSVCTQAKYVSEYERFLLVGYPCIDGTWYPVGILSSAFGDENNFVSSNSGYYQAGEGSKITGFGELQGIKYIFKENSRVQMWLVASADVFNFRELKDSFGTRASHSIINDDKGNLYYLASDNTIKLEGSGTISQPIQTEILDKINPAQVNLVRSAFVSDYKELMWSIPLEESSQNNCVIAFKDGIWLLLKNIGISDFGYYYTS
ncbi:MAG: hypothetical protein WDA59_10465 [Methanofastidiosum sp.]